MRASPFMLTVAAALLVPAAAAAKSEPPVGCVYGGTYRIERGPLAELIKNGMQPKTNADKIIVQQIGQAIGNCRSKYGWGEKRQSAAVRYLTARVLREDALYQGKDMGLTAPLLDGLVGTLDPASRANYARGAVSGAMSAAALANLKQAGLNVDTLSAENQQKLAGLIGQALAGSIMVEDATAAFAA